jgi:hypothetical protein
MSHSTALPAFYTDSSVYGKGISSLAENEKIVHSDLVAGKMGGGVSLVISHSYFSFHQI